MRSGFRFADWIDAQEDFIPRLTQSNPKRLHRISVALSGYTALVGAIHENPDLGAGPLSEAGSVYVFVRSGSTWGQQT